MLENIVLLSFGVCLVCASAAATGRTRLFTLASRREQDGRYVGNTSTRTDEEDGTQGNDGNNDGVLLKETKEGEARLDEAATSTWAVHVLGGSSTVDQIATDLNAVNLGQVRHGGVGVCTSNIAKTGIYI